MALEETRGPQETRQDRDGLEIGAGDVMIAAITSCTNTSNPGVLLGAGLLAKKAVERGLRSAAREDLARAGFPGRDRVSEKGGAATLPREARFNLAAYGCTTCIGTPGRSKPP